VRPSVLITMLSLSLRVLNRLIVYFVVRIQRQKPTSLIMLVYLAQVRQELPF